MAQEILHPSGDVITGWSTTGSNHWDEINDPVASANDSTYISSTTENDVDQFGLDNSDLSDTDTISQVDVKLRYRVNAPSPNNYLDVDWIIGGTPQGTTARIILIDNNAWYNITFNDVGWNSDWTASELDGAQISITVVQLGMPAALSIDVSAAEIVVTYTGESATSFSSSGNLFISGHKSFSASGDLFINGSESIATSGDLFVDGYNTVQLSGDLFIHGRTDYSSSGDLYIHGLVSLAVSGDLFIDGQDSINTSGDLFVHGQDSTAISGDLFTQSHETLQASGDLFISGSISLTSLNSSGNLYIFGNEAFSASGDLFIKSFDIIQISGDLFVSGPEQLTASGDLFIAGTGAISLYSEQADLFIEGQATIEGSGNLFIDGHETYQASGDIFIKGQDIVNISGNLFVEGNSQYTSSGNLYVRGFDSFVSSGNIFIGGQDITESSGNLYIHGYTQTSGQCNLFISGALPQITVSESIDLFISGSVFANSFNDSNDLYIRGYDDSVASGNLFIQGNNIYTTSGSLYMYGYDSLMSSGDMFIGGQDAIESSGNIYIYGNIQTSGQYDLFISGTLPQITVSGSINLFIAGSGDELSTSGSCDLFIFSSLDTDSDSINLFINGLEPKPALACPVLDPTAAIQIKASLISTYQNLIDDVIDQLGKNVLLEFDPLRTPCPNCEFDIIRKRSTGVYKIGGPRPFVRGRRCPYCKGHGLLETAVTSIVKCLTKWNPADAENYGIAVAQMKDIVRLKSYLTDADDLVRARTIVVNYDIVGQMKMRVRLIQGPIPIGLREDRYCITFWELI